LAYEHKHFLLDRLGILISALCLLHCFLPPVLVLAFPMISAVGAFDFWIHMGLALLIVPVAYKAILQGYRHHKQKSVPALATIGFVVFALSLGIAFFDRHEHTHARMSAPIGLLVSAFGSILISAAHGLNLWFCRPKKL
jgi:hypothetical protein